VLSDFAVVFTQPYQSLMRVSVLRSGFLACAPSHFRGIDVGNIRGGWLNTSPRDIMELKQTPYFRETSYPRVANLAALLPQALPASTTRL